ncbi:hypothetical protein [Filifactor villosus]|uniref:Uncharacterized protein n=1 Tax=Filifactor villosus TaxID=29374 RepID=A0ABV9QH40_9FIRM
MPIIRKKLCACRVRAMTQIVQEDDRLGGRVVEGIFLKMLTVQGVIL